MNANCPAKLLGTILHFASRGVMNIDGMGEAMVEHLTKANAVTGQRLVNDVADIYRLRLDQLLTFEHKKRPADTIGKEKKKETKKTGKFALKLLQNIAKSKAAPFSRVILGLGIPSVGVRTAEVWQITSDQSTPLWMRARRTFRMSPTLALSSPGDKMFFSEPKNRDLAYRFALLDSTLNSRKDSLETSLKERVSVLTGALKRRTREDAKRLIEEAGGRV